MIMLAGTVLTHENSGLKEKLTAQGLRYGHDFDFCGLSLRPVKGNLPLEKLSKHTTKPFLNCEYLIRTYLGDAAVRNFIPQDSEDTSPPA